jgi:hypothetical protein
MVDLSGVKYVQIGGRNYEIEGAVTDIKQIKEKAVEVDPSLANSDAIVSGDTIIFQRRAGTKGATSITEAIVGGQKYEVDPTIWKNPQDIKEELTKSHPELANADYVISGSTMTFVFRAGTKGC